MTPSRAQLANLVARYGDNTVAFVSLYEGYRYFSLSDVEGALPYLETPHAWIGAGEPLAAKENWGKFLRAFHTSARAFGKVAMLLPVSDEAIALARKEGYGHLKIGSEPILDLTTYKPLVETVSTAKRLYDRGARVSEFAPERLSVEERRDLDTMVQEWLDSRKMDPLGFLNRVEPWTLSNQKKYFRNIIEGKTLSFVAAVPIGSRQGWYLIDIFRRHRSPPGSTELLILEASRLLKAQGAQRITLGMAPLADLPDEANPPRPWLSRFLHFNYRYGGLTYGFRSLHLFKLKFRPTNHEPCHLLFYPNRMTATNIRGLMEATVGSPGKALRSAIRKRVQRLDWMAALESRLARDFVLRPAPKRVRDIAARVPLTISLFVLLSFLYACTNDQHIREFAFRWSALENGELPRLIGSHLLHGGLGHLSANLLLLVMAVGTLEYFRGTSFTFSIYLVCALFSNPLTSLAFLPAHWFAPGLWEKLLHETDVGASLGIFGCVGSLVTILKQHRWVLPVLGVFYVAFAAKTGNLLALSHATALFLGAFIEVVW